MICHLLRALRLSVTFCLIYKGLLSDRGWDRGGGVGTWLFVGFQPIVALLPFRCQNRILVVSAYQHVRLGFFEKLPRLCTYYIEMVSAGVG